MADSRGELPHDLGAVTPYMTQRGRDDWKENDPVTVELTGEVTRAKVIRVLHQNILLVELVQAIVSPRAATLWSKGDIVKVRRAVAPAIGNEIWKILTPNEEQQEIIRAELDEEDRRRAAEAERQRVDERHNRDLAARAQSERERQEREARAVEPEVNTDNWSA